MKILILANNSLGLYRFRGALIGRLLESHIVYASSPRNDCFDELERMGVHMIETPVDRRGTDPFTDIKLYRTYLRMMRDIQPDLVITYTIKANVYGGYAARRAHIPYAANVTGTGTAFQRRGALRRLATQLNRVGLKGASIVFFENAADLDLFCRFRIVLPRMCHVLNGAGVDVESFMPTPYPSDDAGVRFLFIGRVMKEKGMNELFASMRRLRAAGSTCTLHIVGECEDDYREVIRQGEAEGWLVDHGYRTDVRPFIADAHCLVLPSYHEGMANVNLEAAAMGRPLITSRIPGCMEAVREGESGYLCAPCDVESLHEQMVAFLQLSQTEREAMGRVGRAHMETVFDKRKVVSDTLEALRQHTQMTL